jgi:hypothetical protein
MNAISTVALAQSLGVTLFVLDGRIAAKPSSAVTGLLRQEVRAHKDELLTTLGAAHETAYTDTVTRSERQRACVGKGGGRDTGARAQQGSRGRSLARGIEAPQVGLATPSTGPATGEQQAVSDTKRQALAAVKRGDVAQIVSATLGESVYWVQDEETAERLTRAPGYQGEVCYTLAELRDLTGQSPELLRDIHQFKKTFRATLEKVNQGVNARSRNTVRCGDCQHFERVDRPHMGRCAKGHGRYWLWDTDRRECADFEAAVEGSHEQG